MRMHSVVNAPHEPSEGVPATGPWSLQVHAGRFDNYDSWLNTHPRGFKWRAFLLPLADGLRAAMIARTANPDQVYRLLNTETGDTLMVDIL
jgi:hypothetical protein